MLRKKNLGYLPFYDSTYISSFKYLSKGGCQVASVVLFTVLHCVFSNVSSNGLPKKMHNYTDCICLTFLHCAFSNVLSSRLPEGMQNHTACICLSFLHCVFLSVSSDSLPEEMQSHINCIFWTSQLCLSFSKDFSHFHPFHSRHYFQELVPLCLCMFGCALPYVFSLH